jgi:hypothetical protein
MAQKNIKEKDSLKNLIFEAHESIERNPNGWMDRYLRDSQSEADL